MKKIIVFLFSVLLVLQTVNVFAGPAPVPAPTPAAVSTPTSTPTPEPAISPLLQKNHFKIEANPDRTVFLKGEIDTKLADQFIEDINNLDVLDQESPIYIVVSSIGGSIEDGARMENNMDALRAPTVCIVDDYAHSMAAGIFLHCGSRYMRPRTTLMFHFGSVTISGDRYEALESMNLVMKQFDQMDQDNATHLGMTLKAYRAKVVHGWWLTDDDALKAGIVDGIVDGFRLPTQPPKVPESFFNLFP